MKKKTRLKSKSGTNQTFRSSKNRGKPAYKSEVFELAFGDHSSDQNQKLLKNRKFATVASSVPYVIFIKASLGSVHTEILFGSQKIYKKRHNL